MIILMTGLERIWLNSSSGIELRPIILLSSSIQIGPERNSQLAMKYTPAPPPPSHSGDGQQIVHSNSGSDRLR